jgi:hypothetical protein
MAGVCSDEGVRREDQSPIFTQILDTNPAEEVNLSGANGITNFVIPFARTVVGGTSGESRYADNGVGRTRPPKEQV